MKGFGIKLDDTCGSTEEGGELKAWAWGQIALVSHPYNPAY